MSNSSQGLIFIGTGRLVALFSHQRRLSQDAFSERERAMFSGVMNRFSEILTPRREQVRLQEDLVMKEKAAQELRVDEFSIQKLRESHETTQMLTSQVQELQDEGFIWPLKNIIHVPIPQIQEQFVERVEKIPQERLLFERIEEQIGDILVPPIVEETVKIGQKFLLERIQQRTVVQTVVAPALQVVAPFPDVALVLRQLVELVYSSLRGHSHW